MSTDSISTRYYRESEEGVDAVLDRLARIAGAPPELSWADALDVSKETVKTWRRRGEVPLRYLKGFAAAHGASLDYLRRGGALAVSEPGALGADEQRLLAAYRRASAVLRKAALRVLEADDGGVAGTALHQVNVSAPGGQAAGRDIRSK